MKNNKIYMTLAHLYNQIKGVVGDSGRNLSEEIDKRIEEHKEVTDARKGHNSLLDKVNAIDSAIDNTNNSIMDVNNKVNSNTANIEKINTELDDIKSTNPTVELDNGNHLLVNLDSRPSHRSYSFELEADEQYRANVDAEHYVTQLYVRDNIHNTEVDLSFEGQGVSYDEVLNVASDGSLESAFVGEARLPMHNLVIANQGFDNIATIPEFCEISGIISSGYINETSHVVSAFKTGYSWVVKSTMADMIIKFVQPIEITRINFDFTANTIGQVVSIYEWINDKWDEVVQVQSTDGVAELNKPVSYIKVSFRSLSASATTVLKIKNVQIYARAYNTCSDLASITKQIDLYDLSGYANLSPIIDIPETTFCKFGINHSADTGESYVYYPNTRELSSNLFKNTYGNYVVGDITSSIKKNYLLDYTYRDTAPTGNESPMSFTDVTWSEDSELTLSNGYKIDNLSYLNLIITPKSIPNTITLDDSMINKITRHTIDGVDIEIELKNVDGVLKIGIKSANPLSDVSCKITSLQNVFSSGNGTSIRPSDGSSTSIEQAGNNLIDIVTVNHSCSKSYYSWSDTWGWQRTHTTYSKYNEKLVYSVAMVDNDNVYSNRRTTSKTMEAQYDENIFTIKNAKSITTYIGVAQSANIAFDNDGYLVPIDKSTVVDTFNEFVGSLKFSRDQKLTRVYADYLSKTSKDIEFYFSFNNYNFYTYNHDTNAWIITKDGMTVHQIESIPSYAYEKLLTGEDIYIKIKINDSDARVSSVNFQFDKDASHLVSNDILHEYGMNLSDAKSISAKFILELVNKFSSLSITIVANSKQPFWKYVVPGMQLIEYGGISWLSAGDNIATQHISGNTLIIKNVSPEKKLFKLEQKYFEDSIVVVGDKLQNKAFEELNSEVGVLKEEVIINTDKVGVLDQTVQLLYDALKNNTAPPAEIPTYIIPSQIEIDLEPLAPGASTSIPNIKNLRYIQYWDTQKNPIPEEIIARPVNELTHQFIYSYGKFTDTHYEMDKYYDTDNSYLMSKTLSLNTTTMYETPDYTCTAVRSDGIAVASRSGYLGKMLTGPNDEISGWYSWEWASNQSNLVYDMPGEKARWVDFDFDFNVETYIHGLFNMDFGGRSSNDGRSDGMTSYTWQETTIFLDYDGSDNWVEYTRILGLNKNKNVIINKAIKKLRIRIEVPYSHNRGTGEVGFKYVDIYHCPVRYRHDEDASLKPTLYYETSHISTLLSVHSDATISGTSTDIHYLFETNNKLLNDLKYWSFENDALVERDSATYKNGMQLQEFNNLTQSVLNELLNYDYFRPIAILYTADGHRTPYQRNITINYAQEYSETTTLVNPQDITTHYDKINKKVIVTNATNSNKTLKAIVS